jgi:hypothetical protein
VNSYRACGAILFGKILRIQSHAQVVFSDPLLIRYGSGLVPKTKPEEGNEAGQQAESESSDPEAAKMPCPVLEFRVVNRLYKDAGGEIMDALLNVAANIDANDVAETASTKGTAPPSLVQSTSGFFRAPASTRSLPNDLSTSARNLTDSTHSRGQRATEGRTSSQSLFASMGGWGRAIPASDFDESVVSRFTNKHVFCKMYIEAAEHPFFKRVWVARHVLDDSSPIVKPKIKKMIKKNGGFWPEKFSSYSGIRACLQFNQILVSLNGISNASASDVYAQKIYSFSDIHIGYQFVNILYCNRDGTLGVDIDLINDVREQNGGGGEPLIMDD